MGHRSCIVDAELLRLGQFCLASGRHDAIHHGVGKRAILINPIRQLRIGQARQRHHGLTQYFSVALNVVTTHAGERPGSRRMAQAQGLDHGAKCRLGLLRVCRVVLDVGVIGIKPLSGGIQIVTPLGDRQTDNPNVGLGHGLDQGGVVRLNRQEINHRPHHLGRLHSRVQHHQGRHAALSQQPLAHGSVAGAHPCSQNGPIMGLTHLHQLMQIPRLVCSMKIAHADVHNARGQRGTVVVWDQNAVGQVVYGEGVHAGCSMPRLTPSASKRWMLSARGFK